MTTRTWFLIKPERPWTKQHDEFLYSDPSLRRRPGQGPTYRIKLSGTRPEVIVQASAQLSPPRVPTPPRVTGNEDGELAFTVSLPRGDRKPEATESTPTPAAVAAVPPSPIPTSPPEQVTNEPSLVSVPPPTSPVVAASTTSPPSPPVLRIVTEQQAAASSGPPHD